MYQYIRAVGLYKDGPTGEQLLDIAQYRLKDVAKYFSEMLVVIKDLLSDEAEVVINLNDYREEINTLDLTIQQWLDAKSSVPLITSNKVPGNEYRYVTCGDIQYQGFSLLPGNAKLSADKQDKLTTTGAPDLRVQKTLLSQVNYGLLQTNCLWTVNGYLTRSVATEDCLYLLNAGRSFNVYDNIHVGYLNFTTLSKLSTYPLTKDQIKYQNIDGKIQALIKTNLDFTNKQVWMSIAGQLYLTDIVRPRGKDSLRVDLSMVDLMSKIYTAKNYINLDGVLDQERAIVDKDYFRTEEFIVNLLTHHNTFLIVLDNPNLSVEVKPIVTYQFPFTYYTEETLKIPLLLASGSLPKYFTRRLANKRLLDIDTMVRRRYLYKTVGNIDNNVIHPYTNRFHPADYESGYLLYIKGIYTED